MKIAYVSAGKALYLTHFGEDAPERLRASVRYWARSQTGVRNMVAELARRGLVDDFEAWKFWPEPSIFIETDTPLAVRAFRSEDDASSPGLAEYVRQHGPPDILFVEGYRHPAMLDQILDLCPASFKAIYTQYWKPWKVGRLAEYDLVLVDEPDHVRKVRKHYPRLRVAVWDKLVDYETGHYPIACEKQYDLCLAAFLSPRKRHDILFRAMARLPERNLTAVCLGRDNKGYQQELESLASGLGVSVTFTGLVNKEELNRYVNMSRIGVMASERDAAPRVVLEYMAAGVPVLCSSELRAGTRYVAPQAGVVCDPDDFHLGITEILDNEDRFSPRDYFLDHFSRDRVVDGFLDTLEQAGMPLRQGRALRAAQR